MQTPEEREFRLAFCKLHVLHHASKRSIYGPWMLQELAEHKHVEELYRELVLDEEPEHAEEESA